MPDKIDNEGDTMTEKKRYHSRQRKLPICNKVRRGHPSRIGIQTGEGCAEKLLTPSSSFQI